MYRIALRVHRVLFTLARKSETDFCPIKDWIVCVLRLGSHNYVLASNHHSAEKMQTTSIVSSNVGSQEPTEIKVKIFACQEG